MAGNKHASAMQLMKSFKSWLLAETAAKYHQDGLRESLYIWNMLSQSVLIVIPLINDGGGERLWKVAILGSLRRPRQNITKRDYENLFIFETC